MCRQMEECGLMTRKKKTVTSLINTFLNCESSVFAENYRYIMYKYNIPSTLWRSDFKTFISNISYIDDINDWQ